ncbi:MAG TPA: aminoacyl-tRNA hydrolase [Candidatus Woesebacteria bacterium]|nr:aminoacyl-tRNA hydrolase [Candidatus Woesebacteria bacterium]
MKLIVGLGNPDKKYQKNRHNLGSTLIKNLIDQKFFNKTKLSAQIFEDKNKIFAVPNEYMNNSGIAVQKISQFYKISANDILIIHDDLDLPAGEYRLQFDRGSAGHNGIKSIIDQLGTQEFYRLRVGIGKPQNNIPVEDYVLQNFSQEESTIISSITPKIFEEIKKF